MSRNISSWLANCFGVSFWSLRPHDTRASALSMVLKRIGGMPILCPLQLMQVLINLSLSQGYDSFWSLVSFRLGDIRFWEDIWFGDISFTEAFPCPYSLSSLHNACVKITV